MIKQVIVIRKDLKNVKGEKIHTGKVVAQACHASISFLVDSINSKSVPHFSDAEWEWMRGSFTKVCLKVNSEEELLEIHKKAQDSGLRSHLILDAGKTEFAEPTHTCLAIGPDESEKIGTITGHLSLY